MVCIYGVFGRGISDHTAMYGAYIRFWPTLHMCLRVVHNCMVHLVCHGTVLSLGKTRP